jgi:cytochrome c biogenesis protein CcmG, thiol:disulfide interchange protein DsbE
MGTERRLDPLCQPLIQTLTVILSRQNKQLTNKTKIMNSLKLTTLLLFLTTTISQSQTDTQQQIKIYYKNSNGGLTTEQQIDSTLTATTAKVSKLGMIAIKDLKNKVVKEDSIIYDFSIQVIDSASLDDFLRKKKIIGKPIPEFALKDVNGKTLKLEDFKGNPMVINFWFTSCPPCVMEIPELNRIKSLPEYSDISFLAITFDNKEKVKKFLTKKQFDFIHIVNAREYCEYFTTDYPVNLFVDKNGIITDLQGGMPIQVDKGHKGIPENPKMNSESFIKALNKISVR